MALFECDIYREADVDEFNGYSALRKGATRVACLLIEAEGPDRCYSFDNAFDKAMALIADPGLVVWDVRSADSAANHQREDECEALRARVFELEDECEALRARVFELGDECDREYEQRVLAEENFGEYFAKLCEAEARIEQLEDALLELGRGLSVATAMCFKVLD